MKSNILNRLLIVLALVVLMQAHVVEIAFAFQPRGAGTAPAAPSQSAPATPAEDNSKPVIPTSIPVGKILKLKNQKNFLPSDKDTGSGTQEEPKGLIGFLVYRVINLLITMIGSFALLVFIYGGVLLITAGGEENMLEKGKTAMVYALIGIVVALMSSVIVAFVQSSLF